MARDFLAFWRLETVDAALRAGKLLNYAASNQYARLGPDDTVWLVTVRAGRLRLVGRVVVEKLANKDEVANATGDSAVWPADHFILPVADTVAPVADIDIHHLVPELRFAGLSDRLTPDDEGLVNGQQLQKMRTLAGNSPELLAAALGC